MVTGADYGCWKRQEERWVAMAEGAPDETAREYIYGSFEKSSQALAGLEKALLALGLLDQAKELDLRSPHQDFFDPIWTHGWRAGDLVHIGRVASVDRDKTADGLDGGRRRHRIVKHVGGTQNNARRPRPQQAIDARKHASAAKVAAVGKAVKALGRTGAPVTRVGVAQLAEVSRSFTYENDAADSIIAEAQTRTQARAEGRIEQRTAQEEASWRERALNAEDEIRNLRRELATQRLLVGDLLGQLREPDGTWIEHDRNRLRKANEHLLSERNQLLRERNELQRRLDGARANVSSLNERRMQELFPDGPGRAK